MIMGIAERKEREKKERRREIMDAAKRLFSSKGFAGTTMEDIAGEVELSPATLYLYFRNKEELYAAFSLKIMGTLLERLDRLQSGAERNPENEIRLLKEELYKLYESDPLIFQNVFHFQTSENYKNMSPELVNEVKVFAGGALGSVAEIFEHGIRKRVFKDRNPIALADALWGMFTGIAIWEESKAAFDPNKRYMKETLDLAFEVFIQGIKNT
jgi:AcrR family transcriptional regulator